MQNGKQKPSCFSEVAGGERRSRTEGRTQGQAHSSERPVATHVQAAEPSRHRGPRCRFLNGPAEIDSKSQWRSGSWVRALPCSRMPSAVFVLFAFTLNPRNQTPASAFLGGPTCRAISIFYFLAPLLVASPHTLGEGIPALALLLQKPTPQSWEPFPISFDSQMGKTRPQISAQASSRRMPTSGTRGAEPQNALIWSGKVRLSEPACS